MPLVPSRDPAAGDAYDYNRSPKDGKHRSHPKLAEGPRHRGVGQHGVPMIGPGHAGIWREGEDYLFTFHFYDATRDGAST